MIIKPYGIGSVLLYHSRGRYGVLCCTFVSRDMTFTAAPADCRTENWRRCRVPDNNRPISGAVGVDDVEWPHYVIQVGTWTITSVKGACSLNISISCCSFRHRQAHNERLSLSQMRNWPCWSLSLDYGCSWCATRPDVMSERHRRLKCARLRVSHEANRDPTHLGQTRATTRECS